MRPAAVKRAEVGRGLLRLHALLDFSLISLGDDETGGFGVHNTVCCVCRSCHDVESHQRIILDMSVVSSFEDVYRVLAF